jgi:hypothetical protein
MGEWETNLKEFLIFLIKKTLSFFRFNSWFMVVNQKLIMVRINSSKFYLSKFSIKNGRKKNF